MVCGRGTCLLLTLVQPEGRRVMTVRDAANGPEDYALGHNIGNQRNKQEPGRDNDGGQRWMNLGKLTEHTHELIRCSGPDPNYLVWPDSLTTSRLVISYRVTLRGAS